MDLINSKNDFALDSSINQLRGNISEKIKELRSSIIYHIAFIESALDDPEHISLDGYEDEINEMLNDNILIGGHNYYEKILCCKKRKKNRHILFMGRM